MPKPESLNSLALPVLLTSSPLHVLALIDIGGGDTEALLSEEEVLVVWLLLAHCLHRMKQS